MKILSGLSTEDSISFSSKNAKVTFFENGRCEFISYLPEGEEKNKLLKEKHKEEDEMLKKGMEYSLEKNFFKKIFLKIKLLLFKNSLKKKHSQPLLRHKITLMQVIFFICEIATIILAKKYYNKFFIVFVAAIGLAFALVYILKGIIEFSKKPKLRHKHGAEHMAYNAFTKDENFTLNKMKNESMFCSKCGSTKPANFLFVEFLNVILAFFTGIYIPHALILALVLNYYGALPLNFFAILYQKFLTLEPNERELKFAQIVVYTLKNVDTLMEQGTDITPLVMEAVLMYSSNEMNQLNNSEANS